MESTHSGIGIASFIIGALCGVLMMVLFVLAGMLALASPEGIDEQAPEVIALGFAIIFCGLGVLTALGLGIAALCQTARKKLFGILGLAFSATTLAITLALLAVGS